MKEEAYRETYRDDHSGGEDEDGDFRHPGDEELDVGSTNTVKTDMRKSNKPIMEKRRRARINTCLNDLKGILLEAMRKDPARHSKLEKADILELTVRHLQNVQRNQLAIAMATDPTVLKLFKNGFSECATEVSRYLGRLDSVENGIKHRLTGHLGACVNGLQQVGPVAFGSSPTYSSPMAFPAGNNNPPSGGQSSLTKTTVGGGQQQHQQQPQDFNNNNNNNLCATTNSSPSSTVTSSDFELTPSRLNFTSPSTSSSLSPPSLLSSSSLSSFTPMRSTQPHVVVLDHDDDAGISNGNLTEKGTNTIPLFNIGGGGGGPLPKNRSNKASSGPSMGLPLDFSLSSPEHGGLSDKRHGLMMMTQRVGKVEPMMKMESEVDSSSSHNKGFRDSMWRPW